MTARAKTRWVPPVLLFLFIVASYLHGHMGCSDSRWSIPTATSLLDEGNFDLDEYAPLLEARGFYFTERVANHYYTMYPFGASILAAPAVVVLRPIAAVVSRRWPALWMSLGDAQSARGCPPAQAEPVIALHSWTEQIIASAIVGLTALLLYAIAREELSVVDAAFVALIFAFGTAAWSTASRSLWQHGPSMLMLATALYFQQRGTAPFAVGSALAFSYVMRPTNSIPLALGSLWVAWNQPRRLGVYVAGVALVLIPFCALNRHIYGAWLSPYYHPAYFHGNPFFFDALFGGLFSPGRGLFVYSPVLAFAVAGIVLKIRSHRFTSLDLSLVACVLFHWIATAWVNSAWWGGDSYGPRFSTDILPYLIYWLIPVVAWLRTSAGPSRFIVGAGLASMAIVSVLMHAQGVLNPNAMSWNREPVTLDKDPARLWDWRHPPFLAGFVAPPAIEQLPDLRTIPCVAPPGPPASLVIVSNRRNTVALSWTRSTGPTGFYIVESASAPGLSDLPSRETRRTALTVSRIPPGTYYARVRAANGCGLSTPSNEIKVVID
jgi:hypothetical protein